MKFFKKPLFIVVALTSLIHSDANAFTARQWALLAGSVMYSGSLVCNSISHNLRKLYPQLERESEEFKDANNPSDEEIKLYKTCRVADPLLLTAGLITILSAGNSRMPAPYYAFMIQSFGVEFFRSCYTNTPELKHFAWGRAWGNTFKGMVGFFALEQLFEALGLLY